MNVFGMVTTRHSQAYTAPALESFFRSTPLGLTDLFALIDNDGTYPRPPGGDGPSVTRLTNAAPLHPNSGRGASRLTWRRSGPSGARPCWRPWL